MKSKYFLGVFFLFFVGQCIGQLENGVKFPQNIKAKDIKGNDFDLFKELDAGKTVVIDVFATWCGPCWQFHESGYLKDLYNTLGPSGLDKVRVVGIEGDGSTPESNLYMEVNTPPISLGDWTKDVPYPIINDHGFNEVMDITFFPTIYVIRPDRSVVELHSFRGYEEEWMKAIMPAADIDVIFTTDLYDKTFCTATVFAQNPIIMNMGSKLINNVKGEIIINNVSTPFEINEPMDIFQSKEIAVGNNIFNESTVVEVVINSVDNTIDLEDDFSKLKGLFIKPIIKSNKLFVKMTTDYFPGEISWKLKDDNNQVIFSQSYNSGPDPNGGGGEDANKEFIHEIIINNLDINCLTLTIEDEYGDGMINYDPAINPEPGVEILAQDGITALKPKLASDKIYASSKTFFAAADFASSVEEESLHDSISVYPNPSCGEVFFDSKGIDMSEAQLYISDLVGKKLVEIPNNALKADISELTPGVYMLTIIKNGQSSCQKIIKL